MYRTATQTPEVVSVLAAEHCVGGSVALAKDKRTARVAASTVVLLRNIENRYKIERTIGFIPRGNSIFQIFSRTLD
jgi:hypothetical protein